MKIFDSVPMSRPQKSKFDLSHERKFTFKMGVLTPIMCQEVLPGDSFNVETELMIRLQPMIAPIMHRVNVYTHYFFVPNRLIWDEWEDFITGGEDGLAAPVPPYFTITSGSAGSMYPGSLCDYLGYPTWPASPAPVIDPTKQLNVSVLPLRAYQLINNEYYRDQNLTDPIEFSKGSGQVSGSPLGELVQLRKRCWEKDYFTSALPWAQRGAEVLIPIEGEADFTYKNRSDVFRSSDGIAVNGSLTATSVGPTDGVFAVGGSAARLENIDEIDFQNTSVTINDLRRSIALQKWLEVSARGGARYTEQLRSHFGETPEDSRLQRPEYLGGGKQPVVISEVLSTVQFEEDIPQGNMSGHGISVGRSNGFRKKFKEHGYIIGIASVIPRTAYQQGIPRSLTRFDKFDYAWPKLANIGEQAIFNKELYYTGAVTNNPNFAFGYQSRYSEYKYMPSTVHGDFRGNLSYWHMGRIFSTEPALNKAFVESDPTTRIFAVTDVEADPLYCQLYHKVSGIRPLPYYGVPAL